ncbi:MAG TPA: group II intron reverse transcriptase/maturase [Gaiellaceae bacterium]|nr:group II intron reverse transcriptase/maturase [Gaiellaceae bacterium]
MTAPYPADASLWERFLSRGNLTAALRRVEQNAGAAGIDGMSAKELRPWLVEHWPHVRSQLEAGTYRPQPVRRVEIPKLSGRTRQLGVPTVLDRLIQQALLQVLTPAFDPYFHDCSFGFRPGRSAHQAVEAARQSIEDGAAWAVDVDLDAFFDRVQHDALMARVARRVDDKQVLRLIRRFLEAGVMADGVRQSSEEGTPQGSPLSPLLANVMLDDLDWELGRRGHRFVRYADDLMIYVRSERAGQRVMESTRQHVESRLKLRVNRQKSTVGPATERTLLGFGFYRRRDGSIGVRIDPKALSRAKDRLRRLTARSWSISIEERIRLINRFTVGWTAYFALADASSALERLDEWLRRRLRQVRWKEWKRYQTWRRNLRALGIPERSARQWAGSRKGCWRIAGSYVLARALPNAYWVDLGLRGFSDPYRRFRDARRTAGCGPACPVVWEGPG